MFDTLFDSFDVLVERLSFCHFKSQISVPQQLLPLDFAVFLAQTLAQTLNIQLTLLVEPHFPLGRKLCDEILNTPTNRVHTHWFWKDKSALFARHLGQVKFLHKIEQFLGKSRLEIPWDDHVDPVLPKAVLNPDALPLIKSVLADGRRDSFLLQELLEWFELFGLPNVGWVEKGRIYGNVKHVFILAKLFVQLCFYVPQKGQILLLVTVFVNILLILIITLTLTWCYYLLLNLILLANLFTTGLTFVKRGTLAYILRQICVCKFIHFFWERCCLLIP